MAKIELASGEIAMIDNEDLDLVVSNGPWRKLTWSRSRIIYAQSRPSESTILMHRLIMGCPPGLEIDHIDHNGLNNRKANLRIVTHAQNLYGRRPNRNNPTDYKGVQKRGTRFRVRIQIAGKQASLGSFDTPEAAARAYDAEARKRYGEYAYLNFPD